MSRDAPTLPSKQRVAGSNPAGRARSEPQLKARIAGLSSNVYDALPRRRARWPRLRSSHLGRRTAAQRVRNALLPRRRARGRRVADGDIEALALLVGLAEETDTATTEAVKGLRARLLLGRDRRPARHQPPGRTTALERIFIQPHGYGDLSSPCPLRVRSAGQCRDSQPLADSRHTGSRASWQSDPLRKRPPKQEIISRRHLPAGTVPPSPRCHHSP
jgi:hypothetical protein